jgi:hypothetical protein
MWLLPDIRGFIACLSLLIACSGHTATDSGLLNATLGRWLDTEVLPELGRILGGHPRFKSEKIRLVTLEGGRPTDRGSRLHEAVKAHLTQRLLKTGGVRIAWNDLPDGSCGVTDQVVYLLGVEIERDGSRYHRLNVGMIDLTESEWVSGVNHTWRGRLTATESAAFAQRVTTRPQGTVDNPLPAHANDEIATSMVSHLTCAHPEGLDGPVYLSQPESPDLARVMASLRGALVTTPIAALTSVEAEAEWVLSLSEAPVATGTGTRQLGLLLTEQSGRLTQHVAAVYVEGSGRSVHKRSDTQIASSDLLSDMFLEPARNAGVCEVGRHRNSSAGSQCTEVIFELHEPAYLFVLSSQDRRLHTSACDSRLATAPAGERRFRVRVAPTGNDLPAAGIYAIAVTDRSAATALSRHIRTGVCSRPQASSAPWLAKLDSLLTEYQATIAWRAIHLTHAPDGVERL